MANTTENAVLDDAGFETTESAQAYTPIYRVVGEAKIPVSKSVGKTWKSRFDHAKKQRSKYEKSWDECIDYFNHDQVADNQRDRDSLTRNEETENVVFANATTMLPAVYSKNPNLTVSPNGPYENKDFIRVLGRVLNILIDQQHINLKPKVRRTALYSLLTNSGWLKLDWIDREFSTEEVYQELLKKADELSKAENQEDVRRIEGELIAIEQKYDVVADSGPVIRVKTPKQILVDPACDDVSDLTTSRWMMEEDYLPTSYIRAKFMEKQEDSDEYRSIYEPTHVASVEDGSEESGSLTGVRFIDYAKGDKEKEERYDERYYTKVWWVWDKVTRLVYLFNDKDWCYPIWVWTDPLKLTRFFPYFGLPFVPSTTGVYGKGETTYYLDQQDAINQINKEQKRVRDWAFNKFIYDKNKITKDVAERIINNNTDGKVTAEGIDVPEGMKVSDIFSAALPPSAQQEKLFSKDDKYKSIDRISAVNDGLRGAQFKTNTTEDAVQLYQDATRIRVGEKVDAIEDLIADLAGSLAELCVTKMDKVRVAELLSEEDAAFWVQFPTAQEFRKVVTVTVAAGSTEKPTSSTKQDRAVKLAQAIGQFAQQIPGPVIMLILKMFSRAFDEFVVSSEEFEEIAASLQQMGQQEAAPTGEGAAPAQDEGATQAMGAAIKLLPPQIKAAIQQAIDGGASPQEALIQVATQGGQDA